MAPSHQVGRVVDHDVHVQVVHPSAGHGPQAVKRRPRVCRLGRGQGQEAGADAHRPAVHHLDGAAGRRAPGVVNRPGQLGGDVHRKDPSPGTGPDEVVIGAGELLDGGGTRGRLGTVRPDLPPELLGAAAPLAPTEPDLTGHDADPSPLRHVAGEVSPAVGDDPNLGSNHAAPPFCGVGVPPRRPDGRGPAGGEAPPTPAPATIFALPYAAWRASWDLVRRSSTGGTRAGR